MNRKISNKKERFGFTLIELVVSIGIIMMVTVLFISNYKSSNKRTDLVMTAQEMVSDLHAAQNNALGLVKYNNIVPAGGWGISFDTTKNYYTLFADLNAPAMLGYMDYDSSSEGNVNYGARVTNLSSNVAIASLKIGNSYVAKANVTFLPPDPVTNIYSDGATSTVIEIQLKDLNNPNSIKTVRVNFLGLAEVID